MTEHRFHRIRAFNITALALLLPAAVADILVGMFWLAAFLALLWCGNLASAVCNTQRIHHARASARRPDYAAIARMERDIWGQVFAHAGAPALPLPLGLPRPPASVSVRPCCGTTPGTGHRATCPGWLMNGGTDAGIADGGSFPIGSERELAEAKQRLMRLLRC